MGYDMEILEWMLSKNGDYRKYPQLNENGEVVDVYTQFTFPQRARNFFIREGFLYGSEKPISSYPKIGIIITKRDAEDMGEGERVFLKGYRNYIAFSRRLSKEQEEKFELFYINR